MDEDNDSKSNKKVPPLSADELRLSRGSGVKDDSALEAEDFAKARSPEELKRRAAGNEADRTENFRDHFEKLSLIALYFAFIIFSVMAFVWFFHQILPEQCYFLADDKIEKIQTFLTGGILAGVATGHMKKRLD